MAKIKKKHTSIYIPVTTIKQIKQLAKVLPDENFNSIVRKCIEIGLKSVLQGISNNN
jgi:hypothetical protein